MSAQPPQPPLLVRMDKVEKRQDAQGKEIARGKEKSAADMARFEMLGGQMNDLRDEFHRDLEAVEVRQRDDNRAMREDIQKLGNGQAVILQAIQSNGHGNQPPADAADPGNLVKRHLPVWAWWLIGAGLLIGSVIVGAFMALGRINI